VVLNLWVYSFTGARVATDRAPSPRLLDASRFQTSLLPQGVSEPSVTCRHNPAYDFDRRRIVAFADGAEVAGGKHRVVRDAARPSVPGSVSRPAASLAISAVANVKAVQQMLGRASAAMTLDVYAGLFDEDLDAVSAALDHARAAEVVRFCAILRPTRCRVLRAFDVVPGK
jgi:hypothetical protein